MRGYSLAVSLTLLASCRPNPPAAPCQRLQVRNDKLTYSTGPPPHYGYSIRGFIVQKDALQAGERSLPRKLKGADGTAEFLPKFSRVQFMEGYFYFTGIVEENSYQEATGFLKYDPTVRIEFEDPVSGIWWASGTLEIIPAQKPFHPDIERAFEK